MPYSSLAGGVVLFLILLLGLGRKPQASSSMSEFAYPFPTCDHNLLLDLPADPIGSLVKSHPRLLLSDNDLDQILQASEDAGAETQRQLFQKIVSLAEDDLLADVEYYMKDNIRLANKPTTRSPALKKMKNRIVARVLTLAMAYRLTKDARFAAKAVEMMRAAASFPDWFPFHFLTVAEMSFTVSIGYDWLYNFMSEEDRQVIEEALFRNCLSMAPQIYEDFVTAIDNGATPLSLARSKNKGDEDDEEESGKGRKGTGERNPWVNNMNNQNQVGNSGMLAAALALADKYPDFSRLVVKGAVRSMPLAQCEYYPDGCYPEGPGYWGFGSSYAVNAFAMMDTALGTDFGLHSLHGFPKTVFYRMHVEGPSGLCFSYADSVPDQPMMPCFHWLANRFGNRHSRLHASVAMQNMLASDAQRSKSKLREFDRFFALHAVWYRTPEGADQLLGRPGVCSVDASNTSCSLPPEVSVDTPLDVRIRGRGVDMAFLRGSWNDPNAVWVGLKAGYNTVHHSHLDLGTFVFEKDGVRWSIDMGKDSYGLRKYNSHLEKSPRWSYLRPSNRGHSTISLGEHTEGDRPGDGDVQCLDVQAPITHFLSTPSRAHAVTDLSDVYSWPYLRKKALKNNFKENPRSVVRGVALLNRTIVMVRDEICVHGSVFKGNEKGKQKNILETEEYSFPVVWRMYTEAAIVLDEGSGGRVAVLHQGGKRMRAEILSPTPSSARFTVLSALPPSVSPEEAARNLDRHGDEKPETEDPNVGISVLAIELLMSDSGRAGENGCNGIGACAGAGGMPCKTLVIAVKFVPDADAQSCAADEALPLSAWGGAL